MKLNHGLCNELFGQLPLELKRSMINIATEYQSACEKHKEWPMDFIHAAAIVAEESGELVQASLQHRYEKGRFFDMHKEAIQTGAMAVRFLVNAQMWWCDECGKLVPDNEVTFEETHDPRQGGCGSNVE